MHNHLRHLVVNFLVSKLFTRVGPRAAFVIRIVENSAQVGTNLRWVDKNCITDFFWCFFLPIFKDLGKRRNYEGLPRVAPGAQPIFSENLLLQDFNQQEAHYIYAASLLSFVWVARGKTSNAW